VAFGWRWEGEGRWRSAGEEMRRGKKFWGTKNVASVFYFLLFF
jgi:hypothetical protein